MLVDRAGKGIRTAPRDALISLSAPADRLGAAFGVHRAMDTTGALLGPLIAFGLLALAPGSYDATFVVSFCFAIVGLAVLLLFVQNRTRAPGDAAAPAAAAPAERPSLREASALLRERPFAAVVLAGTGLGLATVSDAFVYLALQQRTDLETSFFPLLFVGTALVYMLLAVPAGRLADRIGRGRVFLGGYAVLLLVYTGLFLPLSGPGVVALYVGLLGAYYAATDGVLMALTSSLVPEALRGSGLGLVSTATSLARLVSSIAFGALWTAAGLAVAGYVFAAGLALALVLALVALRQVREAWARV